MRIIGSHPVVDSKNFQSFLTEDLSRPVSSCITTASEWNEIVDVAREHRFI